MRYREIIERSEAITTPSGRSTTVVIAPTKPQLKKLHQDWKGRLRACLDTTTDLLYICDAWDMYHYQMIKQLGLDKEKVVGFRAGIDGVGLYYPSGFNDGDELPPYLVADLERLRKSRTIKRLYGADFRLFKVDPD